MKDERGEPLVRALSEGTRKMREEMEKLGLPPPVYETDADTTLTLYNQFEERLVPHAYINAARGKPPQRRGQLTNAMRVIGETHSKNGLTKPVPNEIDSARLPCSVTRAPIKHVKKNCAKVPTFYVTF